MASNTWISSRAARVRSSAGMVVGLIVTSATVATAISYWADKIGLWAFLLLAGFLLGWAAVPERTWARLTADPAALVRARAIDALQERLAEADALRHRLLEELPTGEAMTATIEDWLESAHATVIAHAPEYRSDIATASATPAGIYILPGNRQLSMEQQTALRHFDHRREILASILDKVRSR